MGESTSGAGGNDDLDRVWRRPAPGDPEPPAHSGPAFGRDEHGSEDDRQRAVWGPGASPATHAPVESAPATWHPPPAGPPASAGAAAPPASWLPVVGAGPGDTWPASSGAVTREDIGIDERPAPPSRPPAHERFAGWWTRAGVAAAVLAMVIAVVAVASGSDSGGEASTATSIPATSSPATTARRTATTTAPATTTAAPPSSAGSTGQVDPEDLAPDADPRVMLIDLPEGFAANGARLALDERTVTSGLLFVGDRSTWLDGPWIRIEPAADVAFLGPTTPVDLAGRSARLGTSQFGAETVVVEDDGGAVAISAKGTEPGTAPTTAAALAIGAEGTWSVPAAALPPGLRPATGDLGASLTSRRTTSARVSYIGPGGVEATVYSSLAQPGHDPLSVAPFYLSDLVHVSVGGEPGVMGAYRYPGGSSARAVRWRRNGVDIEVTSFRMEAAELLDLAARASTRAEAGWSERQWSAAEGFVSGPDEPEPVAVEPALQFGEEGDGRVQASRYRSRLSWWIEPPARSELFFIGRNAQDAAPIVLQVASNPVPATETGAVSYIVAMALGDASVEGASVRLRVGALVSGAAEGSELSAGASLHPLDPPAGGPSEFGYTVGAALALPWTEGGFLAELIAADGVTVLASATAADLG